MFGRALPTREITLQQRVISAYLGLAIGDALGATTEFMTPLEIRNQYGVHNKICGGGWLHLKPGQVTDDTQMSLALGQSIIDAGGADAVSIAQAFSDWMRSKPIDIGHTVRRGILHFRSTGESSVEENEFDAGNGACMRCLPIAIAYCKASTQQMIQASRLQSHTTHHNASADAGTEAVIKMLLAAFHAEPKSSLEIHADELVKNYPAYRFNDRRRVENPSGWIVETLQAVFQAFFQNDSFESILTDVVNRGGDADTTGAIAGMLAGAYYGKQAIPRQWLNTLDAKIRQRCESQAVELLSVVKI